MALVLVALMLPAVASADGNSGTVDLCRAHFPAGKPDATQEISSFSECVSTGAQGGAYLVTTREVFDCGGGGQAIPCWGAVVGLGLQPGTLVYWYGGWGGYPTQMQGAALIPESGTFGGPLGMTCGYGWTDVYFVGTAADGTPITSNVVSSPCG
jgi:hypothetical protein